MNIHPALINAASRGDRKAQYDLYRMCYPMLMATGMRYLKDKHEAAAVVNEAFVKIVQHLPNYTFGDVPFGAWAHRIMVNKLIDAFRREKKWRESVSFPEKWIEPANAQGERNEGELQLDAAYLQELLQRLPDATQHVFNLFAIEGYSHREISDLLGISEGTSKWHVNNARQQLQSWIKARNSAEQEYGKHR
jgi:RNA polymerase sigma factor (sigma-70 family)